MSQPTYCRQCGTPLKPQSQFCPKCGKEVTKITPPASEFQPETVTQPSFEVSPLPYQTQPKEKVSGLDNRILTLIGIIIVIVILVLPIIPVTKTVMVSGTTQSVTNSTSFSTSLELVTESTQSQISVYTGSFQYFSNPYYYNNYNPWWGNNYCSWTGNNQISCNYWDWNWYQPSYGTTVTVTPDMNVVNVIRSQQGYGESLVLVYANGQQSQTYTDVYADNLAPSGVSTIPNTTVATNTIVSTAVNPVTQTVPCDQCVASTTTEHVSIIQYIFGLY